MDSGTKNKRRPEKTVKNVEGTQRRWQVIKRDIEMVDEPLLKQTHMEYVYLKRQDDEKIITEYKERFESKTLEELVEAYNKEAKCGIVGVHQQALYLIALKEEFRERLKESPIYLLKYVLGLVGEIELVNGHIRIKEHNEKKQ